ncbi:GIY-YIG nuclease family protein [Candidatus Pristimantibacillus sp. PTI5]|uniref:GIY-YIG nuclease family protein n=1 Tax=Candidatus Pristimantibacillus sp. PTI5 TaxID=3400422 RepID=UPI003B0284A5
MNFSEVYGIIYRITNNFNGKVYIGQTTRLFERRMSEHFHCSLKVINSPLYHTIKKNGWENFDKDIIDFANSQKELDEKEIEYIDKYRSCTAFPDCNGYNLTLGGGGTAGRSDLLTDEVIRIKELLRDTSYTQSKIADIIGIHDSLVSCIYNGTTWNHLKVDGFTPKMDRGNTYPKGENVYNCITSEEEVIKIKELLRDTSYLYPEIAEMIGCSVYIIQNIYFGRNHTHIKVDGFAPNMDRDTRLSERVPNLNALGDDVNKIIQIKKLLMENKHTQQEIGDMFGVTFFTISKIKTETLHEVVWVQGFKEKMEELKEHAMNPNKVSIIKRMILDGVRNKVIRNKFKISKSMVNSIGSEISWKWVEPAPEGQYDELEELNQEREKIALVKRMLLDEIKPLVIARETNIDYVKIYRIRYGQYGRSILPSEANYEIDTLTDQERRVSVIKRMLLDGIKGSLIAKRYNFTTTYILDIRNEKLMGHVQPAPEGSYKEFVEIEEEKKRLELIALAKRMVMDGVELSIIADRFGLTTSNVNDIRVGKSYAHVIPAPEGCYDLREPQDKIEKRTKVPNIDVKLVEIIKRMLLDGVRQSAIARRFGIKPYIIGNIQREVSYKDVEPAPKGSY